MASVEGLFQSGDNGPVDCVIGPRRTNRWIAPRAQTACNLLPQRRVVADTHHAGRVESEASSLGFRAMTAGAVAREDWPRERGHVAAGRTRGGADCPPQCRQPFLRDGHLRALIWIGPHQFGVRGRCFRLVSKLLVGTGDAHQRLRRQRAIRARRTRCLQVERDRLRQITVGVFLDEGALVQFLCTLRGHVDGGGQHQQNADQQTRARHAVLPRTNLYPTP